MKVRTRWPEAPLYVTWAVLRAGTGDSQTHTMHRSGHLGVPRVEEGSWRQSRVFVGLKLEQLDWGMGGGSGSLRKRIQNYLIFASFAKTFDRVSTLLKP